MRDVQWVTQNCLMTFDTIGIWPETVDGTDLVVGARSWSGSDFVAGDDFGKLKLYNFPVVKPKVILILGDITFRTCLIKAVFKKI